MNMIGTLDDFCDELMRDESPARRLEPERLAADFPRFFGLSGRPTLDELAQVFERAGIGKVSPRQAAQGAAGDSLHPCRRELRHPLPGGAVGVVQRIHPVPRGLRDRSRNPVEALPRPATGAEGVPGGGPVRGGGADAGGHLRRLRPGQRAGRGGPGAGSFGAPTPRRRYGWAR